MEINDILNEKNNNFQPLSFSLEKNIKEQLDISWMHKYV